MSKLIVFGSLFCFAAFTPAVAQFDVCADIVSGYVWRGSILADGPSIQPCISYATGSDAASLEVGAWGSYSFFGTGNGDWVRPSTEADLYATLGLGPVSLTITDYYFPSAAIEYFDYDGGHTLEAALGVEIGGLSLLGAYNFAGARDLNGDGKDDPGVYFEAAYSFSGGAKVFAGLGDEFYQAESFGLVNLGVGYEKLILEKLPAFGQVVVNPEAESFAIVFGISL